MTRLYLGIDVGTGSVRAGIFDAAGTMLGTASNAIEIFRPAPDFVEQSSDDIWRGCGEAARSALREAGASGDAIAGIGFDATCSLVVLENDRPISASPTGNASQNVIVWMDHRAIDQARRINETKADVLKYVGGVISPEMEMPKLLWLKENLHATFDRATHFFDLPDFLTYRATGIDTRSLCTTVCKWTYVEETGWDAAFLRAIGLDVFAREAYARIGTRIRPMGERISSITTDAARHLGVSAEASVGVSIIDAHAGGLGLLGAAGDLERTLALIGGTSTCHMAVSREPRFIPGIWGPYGSAMIPGMWLTEGGQSATGALIDHTIASHARGAELGPSPTAVLNARLAALAASRGVPVAELTRDLHVLPDHHGNRSPRADPTLRGMLSGLALDDSVDALALLYLATVQALAHGTRHILDVMRAHGYAMDTIAACGGDTKNPLFLREHADITGCRVVLPREPEAVLLGAAILGRVACGDSASIPEAMAAMDHAADTIEPARSTEQFHAKKHEVFLRMYDDRIAYKGLMR